MTRIFVSSTFQDLKAHRQSVIDVIRQAEATDVAMEHFGARDDRPKEACLALIREQCDIFVGIYGHRYGFIPDGEATSITEQEYDAASEAGLQRLVYLSKEDPPADLPAEPTGVLERLQALKARLKSAHIAASFTSPADLAAKVAADLARYYKTKTVLGPIGHRGILHQPAADWVSPVRKNPWRYKVIAFDLDGTLVRADGFKFSWEAVWTSLGFARSTQVELQREYRQRAHEGDDDRYRIEAYRAWCRKAIEHFMARKLTRDGLRELAAGLRLTRQAKEALVRLREEGFVLALISGGIHTFLEDLLPQYRDLFDFAFINELRFDAQGRLSDLIPTEFDFEGKARALEHVCERAGCALDETVFVGDAFNDEAILLAAKLAIAYPPGDAVLSRATSEMVADDDLTKILPLVMKE